MGRPRTKKRALDKIIQKSHDSQQHWRSGASPGVANLCLNLGHPSKSKRRIMCFLVGVLVRVQAPRWISGASNHAPTTMGTTIALLSIATTFFVLVANEGSFESPLPAVDPDGRSLIERLTTSFKRQLLSAPSNMRPDPKAPTRAKRKPSH